MGDMRSIAARFLVAAAAVALGAARAAAQDSSSRNSPSGFFPDGRGDSARIFEGTAPAADQTSRPRRARCRVGTKDHKGGDTWESDDGCNLCSCTQDSQVMCTEQLCLGPDGRSRDPAPRGRP